MAPHDAHARPRAGTVAAHAHDHAGPRGHAGHTHAPPTGDDHVRRLRVALVLTAVFLLAEVVGGLLSNSLALLADAGHMATDAAALALSLFVAWFSRQQAGASKTYGYLRWEVLAAFINGSVLLLVSAWIAWESLLRLRDPEPLRGGLMLGVAVVGLLVNVVVARMLHPASEKSMNVRGAYLHVLGDLLGSVGTVTAAVIVRYTGWLPADPIASLLVTALIVFSAWRLVRESVDVLLESAPSWVSPDAVRQQLLLIPGIESVHDLHIWTVSSGVVAMSAHAVVPEPQAHQHVLQHVHDAMRLFGIDHVTVQLERREMNDRELHLHE